MIQIQIIKGLSLGMEYVDHEEYGFVINIDLGVFRVTWYKDIVPME